MPTYHKRTESTLLTACLQYLQLLENSRQIIHVDRLNTGDVTVVKRYFTKAGQAKEYWGKRRGCREGTWDAYFVTNDWLFVFFETKMPGEELSDEQKDFRKRLQHAGHIEFLEVYEVNDIETFFKNKFIGRIQR